MMRRRFILVVVSLQFFINVFAQENPEGYGNNNSAGKFCRIRGFNMYYETYGSGEPLLMIHGNGGSISSFSNNIPFFAGKYKVIATDSRAHGKSIDEKDSLSFEMMADDEAALLDSLHIDSASVIGWSDGGIIALVLAMRHPEKVKKLVSTGANLWPDSTALIPSLWNDMTKEYERDKNKRFITAKEKNDWKIFLLDFEQPHIALPALQKIQCPALIVGGDHDLIPIEHTTKIYENIPRAYLWIVPNSGHGTLIEHKDEFNKIADDFFTQPFKSR